MLLHVSLLHATAAHPSSCLPQEGSGAPTLIDMQPLLLRYGVLLGRGLGGPCLRARLIVIREYGVQPRLQAGNGAAQERAPSSLSLGAHVGGRSRRRQSSVSSNHRAVVFRLGPFMAWVCKRPDWTMLGGTWRSKAAAGIRACKVMARWRRRVRNPRSVVLRPTRKLELDGGRLRNGDGDLWDRDRRDDVLAIDGAVGPRLKQCR